MNKRIWIILSAVLIVAAAVATVFAVVSSGESKADDGTIRLDRYWADYRAEKGEEPISLQEIYTATKQLCASGKVIKFRAGYGTANCIKWGYGGSKYSEQYYSNQDITVDFSEKPADEKDYYFLLIAALDYFDDRAVIPAIARQEPVFGRNSLFPYVFFYTEKPFTSYGYENVVDAVNAMETDINIEYYVIDTSHTRIIKFPKGVPRDSIDLYDSIYPQLVKGEDI